MPDASIADRLQHAAAECAAVGASLTANRRDVLGVIMAADAPLSAYAILDRLKATHPGAVPPTVYRALSFLMERGLVHKIERLNAFVACAGHGDHGHAHAAQFLICRRCGQVTEIDDHAAAIALDGAARRAAFTPARTTVEIEGFCGACAAV